MEWPEWWAWDLEFPPHLLKRMEDRGFNEVELRQMMDDATGYRPDVLEDRFVIETRNRNRQWEVVVEPIAWEQRLVVITAYQVDG